MKNELPFSLRTNGILRLTLQAIHAPAQLNLRVLHHFRIRYLNDASGENPFPSTRPFTTEISRTTTAPKNSWQGISTFPARLASFTWTLLPFQKHHMELIALLKLPHCNFKLISERLIATEFSGTINIENPDYNILFIKIQPFAGGTDLYIHDSIYSQSKVRRHLTF